MNIDELTFGDMKKIAALVGTHSPVQDTEPGDGRPVIVRSRDAGVLYGLYAGRNGSTIKLTNARQMWRWKAKEGGSLVDCAKYGVDASGCKFSVGEATAQVFNACALLDCTDSAAISINAVAGGDWS
jgi:hypothetical protein